MRKIRHSKPIERRALHAYLLHHTLSALDLYQIDMLIYRNNLMFLRVLFAYLLHLHHILLEASTTYALFVFYVTYSTLRGLSLFFFLFKTFCCLYTVKASFIHIHLLYSWICCCSVSFQFLYTISYAMREKMSHLG